MALLQRIESHLDVGLMYRIKGSAENADSQ